MIIFLLILCLTPTFFFFFFNDTATTEIYTLSLHDALPIFAASGSCANATRYCLSCVGTNPVGTLLKLQPVSAISPAYSTRAIALFRITAPTPREYLSPDQAKKRLNGRKIQPSVRAISRSNQ